MTPEFDTIYGEAPYHVINMLQSDHILADFLQELDELQTPTLNGINLKRTHELETHIDPKRIKLTTPTLPLPRKSSSWLRRKQELSALRCELEALETNLVILQMERAGCAVQQVPNTLTEDQELWKSVATIAQQECCNAQAENDRLKVQLHTFHRATEMLESQLSHAHLRQQALLDSKLSFANTVRVGLVLSRRLNSDNSALFDLLESKLGARSSEIHKIVSEAQGPVQDGVKVCRENGQTAIEFKHARLLPFKEDTIVKTIWEFWETVGLGELITNHRVNVTRMSNDLVRMACRFTVPSDGNSVNVDVRVVAKRFDTSFGMVILIESLADWSIEHTDAADWKQSTEEAGWVVVNELPQQENCTFAPACQIRTTMKLRPRGASTGSKSARSGGVGDVVIPSFRDILSSHHQSVENSLLDLSRLQCRGDQVVM